ncbi:MAG TPA: tRNA nucleotidyltransferase, partial [Prolixibacteraceae bacterium]|nr:tRNA nucleotidyltransferase [Prolixibacteraceae bacterium]
MDTPLFRKIGEVADRMGLEAWLIGGYVRDLLLGRKSVDIDIMAVGNGIALAEGVSAALGNRSQVTVFRNFGTALVRYRHMDIEFVG